MNKTDSNEIWNILKTRRDSLLGEIEFIDKTMNLIDKKTRAGKMIFQTFDKNFNER